MGVDIDAPSTHDLLRFGANFMPLSMVGEPFGDCLAVDFYIGILHLLFNSFAMYYFGQVTEIIISSVHVGLLFILAGGRRQLVWKLFGMAGCSFGYTLAISAGRLAVSWDWVHFYFHWHCYRHPLHLS